MAEPFWSGPAPALPVLDRDVHVDVCVIGLGASGLAAVHAARRLGASVAGIDAGRVGAGAAGRNAGFLLAGLADFHHDAVAALGPRRAAALYEATLLELDGLERAGMFERCGSLRIAADAAEEADCTAHLAALARDGFPGAVYDGEEGRGVLVPTDGVVDPLARCHAMARDAVDAGAALFVETPALEVGDGSVRTPSATVHARHVVVAVDGALGRVIRELADRVRPARLQMLATRPAPPRFARPVYSRFGLDYWRQLADGRVLLGGGRDLGGDAEWTVDAVPSESVQRRLDALLHDVLRIDAPVTHRWAGIVGFTDDRLPFFGEVRPGVFATGGYCGTGNVVGVLCGRAAARSALGERDAFADLIRAA
jgi:glycine/D-amino acid oxidase-like deaminating enzyme